ncbi:MAG: hypothetical protein AAF756_10850 [Pseudomonadota bacterium]
MNQVDLTDMLRVMRHIRRYPRHQVSYSLQRWQPHHFYEDGVYKTIYGAADENQLRRCLANIEVSKDVIDKFDKFAGPEL